MALLASDQYLALHGSHVCKCWPCSQPGAHRIPAGLWPAPDRITQQRNRKRVAKETLEERAKRYEVARRAQARTFEAHRHKATNAIRAMHESRAAAIVAEYDGTRGGAIRLAEKHGYKFPNMRKMLIRNGCVVPSKGSKA